MKEALFVLLGFILGCVPIWLDRKRKLKTHWAAIRAEFNLCHERASALLHDVISSPLYRLPISTYQSSFSILLAEGALSESEVLTMGRFFCQVQDMNRGLDNAGAMVHVNDMVGLNREYERNLLKADRLVKSREGEESLYAEALKIVDAKMAKPWWDY